MINPVLFSWLHQIRVNNLSLLWMPYRFGCPDFRLLILSSLFFVACATIPKDEPLYSAYSKYKAEANKENIATQSSAYFSAELLKDKNTGNSEIQNQLLFKDYMAVTHNHFERINGTQGCLTVNGYDSEKVPLVFNIEYSRVHEKWMIKAIDVQLVNSEHEFKDKAICPYEYIN